MAYRVKNTFIDDFDDDGPSSLGPLVKSISRLKRADTPPQPLSEALDFDTPPRLLQQSVADISASKSVVRITLRKNGKLGLTIDATPGGRSLVVRAVLPDGLVEAWNRQCITGGRYLETVNPGDQITVVNDAIYCEGMLNEIRDKSILTLVILREGQSHDRSQY